MVILRLQYVLIWCLLHYFVGNIRGYSIQISFEVRRLEPVRGTAEGSVRGDEV